MKTYKMRCYAFGIAALAMPALAARGVLIHVR